MCDFDTVVSGFLFKSHLCLWHFKVLLWSALWTISPLEHNGSFHDLLQHRYEQCRMACALLRWNMFLDLLSVIIFYSVCYHKMNSWVFFLLNCFPLFMILLCLFWKTYFPYLLPTSNLFLSMIVRWSGVNEPKLSVYHIWLPHLSSKRIQFFELRVKGFFITGHN